jgi:hypothetical protein
MPCRSISMLFDIPSFMNATVYADATDQHLRVSAK